MQTLETTVAGIWGTVGEGWEPTVLQPTRDLIAPEDRILRFKVIVFISGLDIKMRSILL